MGEYSSYVDALTFVLVAVLYRKRAADCILKIETWGTYIERKLSLSLNAAWMKLNRDAVYSEDAGCDHLFCLAYS